MEADAFEGRAEAVAAADACQAFAGQVEPAAKRAGQLGIPLTTFEEIDRLDLTIDGADLPPPPAKTSHALRTWAWAALGLAGVALEQGETARRLDQRQHALPVVSGPGQEFAAQRIALGLGRPPLLPAQEAEHAVAAPCVLDQSEIGGALGELLELLDQLESRIRKVAKRIEQRVDMTPEAQLLLSVPGIGAKTAMLIMAEIGDLSRFPTSHDLTSFAGLVPTTRSSGGKTTHGSLPGSGSPWLRWALVETTQTLKMKPGPVRAHFTRLTRAKGNSKATVAAARKLCCYLFWMLKEGRTYPDWLQNRHSQPLLEVRPT